MHFVTWAELHREIATAWLDALEITWGKLSMRPESSCVERPSALLS